MRFLLFEEDISIFQSHSLETNLETSPPLGTAAWH